MYRLQITPQATPRPRLGKHGAFNPKSYIKYKKALYYLIYNLKIQPGDYCRLDGCFYFPYPKSTAKKRLIDKHPHRVKPDLDNIVKGLMDSLEKLEIIKNDAQICHTDLDKRYTTEKEGYIEFKLS